VHELIYRFLLDSGFPRGSVVADPKNDSEAGNYHPTFLIVDPQTADTLAVIEVVESGTQEELASHALPAGRFASRIVEGGVPAFVIQVDVNHAVASEQVRFYKLLAGKKMQQISSYAFPDLQALQVAQKLKDRTLPMDLVDFSVADTSPEVKGRGREAYILYGLSLFLAAVFLLDWVLTLMHGNSLFSLQQILLLIAAVSLLAIPLLIRQIRQPS